MDCCPQNNSHHNHANHNEHNGHDKHAGHSVAMFRDKFWLSLILSLPLIFYADVVQKFFRYKAPVFDGLEYILFALATAVFFYGGWVFIKSAYYELKAKLPGMMTLIALAITTAYLYSTYVLIIGTGQALFWELGTLITIMLLGHWLEMAAVVGVSNSLKELSKLIPDQAEVMREGIVTKVSLSQIKVDDVVLVKPGSHIPVDGVVIEGSSEVDESLITGESKLIAKTVESEVIAGTMNGDGTLKIKVTKIGDKTFLAGVMRLVVEAETSKSRLQLLSDKAAFYLTIIAIAVGTITLLIWLNLSDASFAIERMVAVLVIACPHALGLAIPLVASISTTKAAQNGFLVKRRSALELAKDINVVLFDKTGTLTQGMFSVANIVSIANQSENNILQMAASVNILSEHSLAKSIVATAKSQQIELLPASQFQRVPGKGVIAQINNQKILVGNTELMLDNRLVSATNLINKIQSESPNQTIIFVAEETQILGAIVLIDKIREESYAAIATLKNLGIKTAMLTGDSEEVAAWVAGELNIDQYFAKVLPEDKSEKVKLLQSQGYKVAMVGDGVNDAPALTQADLGIAVGAGTNIAIESAGIILVKNDPRDIAKVIKLSQLTYTKMIQNLFWATGYNIIAIPLAAGVLFGFGVLLQPAVAAVLMTLSTIIVAVNATLLKNQSI